MTIEVYPSLLPGAPLELHAFTGGSIADWFASKGLDYRAKAEQPVVVLKGGTAVPVDQWAQTQICADDVVEIRLIPHGKDPLASALNRQAKRERKWATGWMMPKKPTAPTQPAEGRRIEVTDTAANVARFGQVVPELLGRFRRFPDYLVPPRRYFVNARDQWTEFICCIGPGLYEIVDAEVKVGETPMLSLGADAEFTIYPPGADVSGTSAHENWYTVSLVGGTASGKSGLELLAGFSSEVNPTAASYTLNGTSITIASAGSTYPVGWATGTMVRVGVRRPYAVTLVTDPVTGSGNANRFTGNFRGLQLAVATRVRVDGAGLAAEYAVRALSLDAAGDGWVVLTANPGGTPTPEAGATLGSQPIMFQRVGRTYRVVSATPTVVTLDAYNDGILQPGWPGFLPETVTAANLLLDADPATIFGGWTSLFRGCPAGERTTTTELDIFFSNGLGKVNNDGNLDAVTVQVEVQYRDSAIGGAFTSVLFTYTAATLDQLGYTERITHGLMAPEFRARRIGAADTSPSVNDDVVWYGLRTRLATRTSYPGWTTMRVKIRGGGRLAAQSENQINVVATRRLPALQLDGSWSAPVATRDIAAAAKYIATSIGYTDADLDMTELRRLHATWAARGDVVDHIVDEMTVKEAFELVFAPGMAELTVEDGRIRPVRDEPRTVWEQGNSPQNMTRALRRSFQTPRPDDNDGVEVEFVSGQTWTKETVRCLLPGDAGRKLAKIKINGVTSRTRAWRIGMRRRRELKYRVWEYSFSTELDALNSRYLSYVPLVDDVPGYGQAAILQGIARVGGQARLRVSEPLVWREGETHVVAYRRLDGTTAGPFPATRGTSEFELLAEIPDPLPVVSLKQEPPHVYFGTVSRWSFPALVTEITPQGSGSVSVTATNYDARVYADDDNAPS